MRYARHVYTQSMFQTYVQTYYRNLVFTMTKYTPQCGLLVNNTIIYEKCHQSYQCHRFPFDLCMKLVTNRSCFLFLRYQSALAVDFSFKKRKGTLHSDSVGSPLPQLPPADNLDCGQFCVRLCWVWQCGTLDFHIL
uniref:Uncharacterized protein n=1 Tax=Cacopsylla melanoneura TaxID=428564 RepID=A0A8D8VU94_9HEMI